MYALVCRFNDHRTVLLGEVTAKLLLRIHALLLLLADEVVGLATGLMVISASTSISLNYASIDYVNAIVVGLLLIA